MTILYRIYTNHGAGDPVDYTAPLVSTPALTYTAGPLGLSTDTTFVVRAFDDRTGFEEASTESRVRIIIAADGSDVSGHPNPPHAVTLSRIAGGGCRVCWAFANAEPFGTPTGFYVYLSQGSVVNYMTPTVTIPYSAGKLGYSVTLPGPFVVSAYTAAVRSFNATGASTASGTVKSNLGLLALPFLMEPVSAVNSLPFTY